VPGHAEGGPGFFWLLAFDLRLSLAREISGVSLFENSFRNPFIAIIVLHMNQDSPLSFLQEWYETLKAGGDRRPAPAEIAVLHKAISIRSRELQRIQVAENEGVEAFPVLFRPPPVSSASSSFEALDDLSLRQLMITQARRAAPWLKQLRNYMEKDRGPNGGDHQSAVELIERKIHDVDAKVFARQVAEELRAVNINVVGGQWWTYSTFQDGCAAFWIACPREDVADNWSTYGLIDMSEAGGTILSGVNDPVVCVDHIAFLISLFRRRHWHSSEEIHHWRR
jgi:hypothetical protein